ncbi:MAG TPA: cytochrome C oxidase subunit IV family protein [Verrucomicrobiae bacterium]|jgi:caa(3)-type oxidase subunit IV|nr:cytochrome C oxidase subunit IV family protein [Verrucomicrobiae bacterium]
MKIAPKYQFTAIWLALIILLFAMFGLSYFNLGAIGTAIILLLAFVQMVLVMSTFMRLRESTKVIRLVAAAGFVWLLFLFVLVFADYLTRQWH